MEIEVNKLIEKEMQLKQKVEVLEKVPVEAMKHFEEALNNENKRSTKRDILFLILGIMGGGLLSVLLKFIGVG